MSQVPPALTPAMPPRFVGVDPVRVHTRPERPERATTTCNNISAIQSLYGVSSDSVTAPSVFYDHTDHRDAARSRGEPNLTNSPHTRQPRADTPASFLMSADSPRNARAGSNMSFEHEATFRSAAPPHHRPNIPADGVVPATADNLNSDCNIEQAATDLIAQYACSQHELRSQRIVSLFPRLQNRRSADKAIDDAASAAHARVGDSVPDTQDARADECDDAFDAIAQPSPTDQPSYMPIIMPTVCGMVPLPPPPAQWSSTPPPRSDGEAAQLLNQFERQHHGQQKPRPQRAAPVTHASPALPTESAASPDVLPPPTLALTDQRAPATRRHAPESTPSSSKSWSTAVPPECWDTAPTEQGMRQATLVHRHTETPSSAPDEPEVSAPLICQILIVSTE